MTAQHDIPPTEESVRAAGFEVPVVSVNTVVVGTGSAGYAAAERLAGFGQNDVVVIADKINAGASRNAGSDKQTYYKLTLSGDHGDSVREMAQTLFSGGAMDGDNALAEAAVSARAFLHLCDLGVPFPQNRYGEFIGYKTDHDPRERATSVGPYTSRRMVEQLEKKVLANGTRVLGQCRVVDVLVHDGEVLGLLVLRLDKPHGGEESPYLLFRCRNIVYATGGPAGLYATRVFPNGQWGASGAAYRAGVRGKNVTEWQFGLASIKPRWNVSGSYMQVLPRFVSTDADGGDEQEFLADAITDYGRLLSLVFLKGYQWPFDVRKAVDGSSLIDLLVYRETVLRGRRVFLDFMRNPLREDLASHELDEEARTYLERAGVLFGTPIQRLQAMNRPAYDFYLERNPYVDLEKEWLEIDVCAQHNNGGLLVDAWWQSNIEGFFPVGEAGGAHGVYRPGGAALNSGQVGATRAARFIASKRGDSPVPSEAFAQAADDAVRDAASLVAGAAERVTQGAKDNTGSLLRGLGALMSAKAGPVRSATSIAEALEEVTAMLGEYEATVCAEKGSRQSVNRVFLVRDLLTTAYVYLSAMSDYVLQGGLSRGSTLYTDPQGQLPLVGHGDAAGMELELPEIFRFRVDEGDLASSVQEVGMERGQGAPGVVSTSWRPVRPIPDEDAFFENVWREYREDGNVR